jgi:hypothetical protein
MKSPLIYATGHIVKPGMNVRHQFAKCRLQMFRIAIILAVSYRQFQRHQGVVERMTKLYQHGQGFAPTRAA